MSRITSSIEVAQIIQSKSLYGSTPSYMEPGYYLYDTLIDDLQGPSIYHEMGYDETVETAVERISDAILDSVAIYNRLSNVGAFQTHLRRGSNGGFYQIYNTEHKCMTFFPRKDSETTLNDHITIARYFSSFDSCCPVCYECEQKHYYACGDCGQGVCGSCYIKLLAKKDTCSCDSPTCTECYPSFYSCPMCRSINSEFKHDIIGYRIVRNILGHYQMDHDDPDRMYESINTLFCDKFGLSYPNNQTILHDLLDSLLEEVAEIRPCTKPLYINTSLAFSDGALHLTRFGIDTAQIILDGIRESLEDEEPEDEEPEDEEPEDEEPEQDP
jgi:hypothetical protein